jgi:hypothetical protein
VVILLCGVMLLVVAVVLLPPRVTSPSGVAPLATSL